MTQTKTVYREIPKELLPEIESPTDPASIWSHDQLYGAFLHDSNELGKCKPSLDQIRLLQKKTPGD